MRSGEENSLSPNRVKVAVETRFIAEQSDPSRSIWVYAYTITITNHGPLPCQLLGRHWIITDATGIEEHVRGDGVVGEQPRFGVGESFEYTSACPLRTPIGSMRGSYQMVDAEGRAFETEIAPFALVQRQAIN
jgi:ApaG protein